MNQFPLYTSLSKNLPKKDLTVAEKKAFIKHIKNMDKTACELVYALIRVYYLNNEDYISGFTIPYGGNFIKDELKFDLELLPKKLKQLLNRFVLLHIDKT